MENGRNINLKKFIITALLATGIASAAQATDLPNKKAAPVLPVTNYSFVNSVTLGYGQGWAAGDIGGNSIDEQYSLGYTRQLDNGFLVGGQYAYTRKDDGSESHNIEGQGGYRANLGSGLSATGRVGVGQRIEHDREFPYFALYGNLDYQVNDTWTINGLQYRYRDSFDHGYGYQSHQLGTGVTYNVNKSVGLTARVFRNYDGGMNPDSDGVMLGLKVSF